MLFARASQTYAEDTNQVVPVQPAFPHTHLSLSNVHLPDLSQLDLEFCTFQLLDQAWS